MKAIILAGGEGTRLRPVSAACPKPMVRLFDRPVLAHSLELLSRHGVTDVMMTLRHLPEQIRSHFGDGHRLGMSIDYRVEAEPLGTAGGVRGCADFIGDDDCIVLSGDAVCDFDLTALIARHRETGAEATIALTSCAQPLEYGLVLTDGDGRVTGFAEKPAWDHVLTDLVNTGIYVLSPRALKLIPEGVKYDFARDLFPRLLQRGSLYAAVCEGSWCDIGGPGAYLDCMLRVIEGSLRLDTGAPERSPGVFSHAELPAGVTVAPPVYIGRNVQLEPGAVIGPRAVIGEGARIGRGARVTGSLADGCSVGENCELTGAIVLPGAVIGAGCRLMEGSVTGENCRIGQNCRVAERVLIWPSRELEAGTQLNESLVSGALRHAPQFTVPGVLRGDAGLEFTPEVMLVLGDALCANAAVAAAGVGGEAARCAVTAALTGVNVSGGRALFTDAQTPAQLAYAAALGGFSASLFVRQSAGQLTLSLFGENGTALTREDERRIERALAGTERRRVPAERCGSTRELTGVPELYCAGAVSAALIGDRPAGFHVRVEGRGPANRALREALRALGAQPVPDGSHPGFELSEDGALAAAYDEAGHRLEPGQLTAALALIDLELGLHAVCPASAPAALDTMARDFGGVLLREGRDPAAAEQLAARRYMTDGVFAVCRLVCGLHARGESLSQLVSRLPAFTTAVQEVLISGSRGAAMRRLAASCPEFAEDFAGGLSMSAGAAHVRIQPCRGAQALLIEAEERDEAAAKSLIEAFAARIREGDRE